jgi:predicted ester cyclase
LKGDQRITALVERFYSEAWNRWDDSSVDSILTADFVFRGSLGDEAEGRDGFRAYRDKVRAAFPDFQNEVNEVVANGDRAAVRLRCTGRHDGELFGIAPTGLRVAYDAAAFLRARDKQLCAAWVLGDVEHLKSQLGTSATRHRQ